jgi:serine/threonine protein kinase
MVIGLDFQNSRTIFMIDFGMARSYVQRDWKTNRPILRKPRDKILLRGTLRYCSANVHNRIEQGRVDDLWSLLYMLIELNVGLPWHSIKEEEKLRKMKETISDEELFNRCPSEFTNIAEHLRTLKYPDRPNYKLFYDCVRVQLDILIISTFSATRRDQASENHFL